MGRLSTLTSGELKNAINACYWLTSTAKKLGLLEPAVTTRLSALLTDCLAEEEDRDKAARDSRAAAVAAHRDPMEHYSA